MPFGPDHRPLVLRSLMSKSSGSWQDSSSALWDFWTPTTTPLGRLRNTWNRFAEIWMQANCHIDLMIFTCTHMLLLMGYTWPWFWTPCWKNSFALFFFFFFTSISLWQSRDVYSRNFAMNVTIRSCLTHQNLPSGVLIWCPQGYLIIQWHLRIIL